MTAQEILGMLEAIAGASEALRRTAEAQGGSRAALRRLLESDLILLAGVRTKDGKSIPGALRELAAHASAIAAEARTTAEEVEAWGVSKLPRPERSAGINN